MGEIMRLLRAVIVAISLVISFIFVAAVGLVIAGIASFVQIVRSSRLRMKKPAGDVIEGEWKRVDEDAPEDSKREV